MFASLKKVLKCGSVKSAESKTNQSSLLLPAIIGLLEDVIFWKKIWLTLCCIFVLNVIFLICIHWDINFLELFFCLCATLFSIDAFETWLKYKHRTACLKKLYETNSPKLNTMANNTNTWIRRRWIDFVYLRETNHTKAFLLLNILFSMLFILGKYMSGYVLLYIMCMIICFSNKIAPPVLKFMRKIQQHAESDGELEGLIPEMSEVDIKILSIEPEPKVFDERQSLDYWKPEDLPLEDVSDSSDNSSSLATNISMDKLSTTVRDVDVETTDSSEDEYIPIEQRKDQLQTTVEVVQPAKSWSSTAYNAIINVTEAVANVVYSTQEKTRKRVSSVDSSDGFEIIDKNDLN